MLPVALTTPDTSTFAVCFGKPAQWDLQTKMAELADVPGSVFSLATELKKALAERMLGAEMDVSLDRDEEEASGNHRNGTSPKTVDTGDRHIPFAAVRFVATTLPSATAMPVSGLEFHTSVSIYIRRRTLHRQLGVSPPQSRANQGSSTVPVVSTKSK